VPWSDVPMDVSTATCRARLLEWQWTQVNGATAWEHIAGELQGQGHLSALTA
jgi:hypothetical protein